MSLTFDHLGITLGLCWADEADLGSLWDYVGHMRLTLDHFVVTLGAYDADFGSLGARIGVTLGI